MPITRSENMARIKGTNTRPEQVLKATLEAAGITFPEKAKAPIGRPDLILTTPPIAIFIDGCFWHGCPTHYVRPGSQEKFWADKLRENVERDHRQTLALEQAGWHTVHIWEHEVFTEPDRITQNIQNLLAGIVASPEPSWRVIQVDVLDKEQRIERRHMVDLRDLNLKQHTDGRRYTTKWKVPKAVATRS